MTQEQLDVVKIFYDLNKSNEKEYGFGGYSQFTTLKNEENEIDDNIVIITTTISGMDNNYIPTTETKNFLVEPNGNYYEMDMMKEVFRNDNEVLTYIQGLTKFDWNGKK